MAVCRLRLQIPDSCTGYTASSNIVEDRRDSILDAIGHTSVVRLRKLVGRESAHVLVKLEFGSPTGSYKDRMALAMIEGAEARSELKPGVAVIEYAGGSTGSSLAFVCAVKGYAFRVVSSDAFAPEKLKTMRAFGADLIIVPSHGGAISPDLIPRMMAEAQRLSESDGVTPTNQFYNRDALDGYEGIGRELIAQAPGRIDAFCAGVGTGGLHVAGALRVARELGPGHVVSSVAVDSGLKYLTGDLFQ